MEEIQPLVRVVDDEEPVRTAIGFLLRNEGFRVATSASPTPPGCPVA